jgi:hypothetical protein
MFEMGKIDGYIIPKVEYDRFKEIEVKYKELTNLLEFNDPVFVTVNMIGNTLGLTRTDVANRPWLMPNFGYQNNPPCKGKKRFWHYGEYLDWVAIPIDERMKMYRDFCRKQNRE